MFDVGFTELLLVGLIALLVLGPERLPIAARTAGLWIGRIKRSFSNIKAEVERELGADEIRRQLHNERILDLEREMNQNVMAPPTSRPTSDPAPGASPAKPTEPTPATRPDQSPEP